MNFKELFQEKFKLGEGAASNRRENKRKQLEKFKEFVQNKLLTAAEKGDRILKINISCEEEEMICADLAKELRLSHSCPRNINWEYKNGFIFFMRG